IDNKVPNSVPPGGGEPNEGWVLKSVDSHACTQAPHDCEAVPGDMGLEGTKWENYRLRGTQVDFTTPTGKPTLLSNSHMDTGCQRSSCMPCHARATVDKDGRTAGFGISDIGFPNPDWFDDPVTGTRRFMQNDF